jgi:hypothetical protein
MSDTIKLFFAFLSMIAIGIIVIALVNNPAGTSSLGTTVFGGFNNLLGTLSDAQRTPTPGH